MEKKKENLSQTKKSFANWRHNKLKLVFPNGNWISTIWGSGSYTENYDFQTDSIEDKFGYETFMDSNDVEIMINCGERLSKKIHKKYNGDGSVIGRLNITQWLEILRLLEKEKKSN